MLLILLSCLVPILILFGVLRTKYRHWKYSHLPGPPRSSFYFGNAKLIRESIQRDGVYGVYHLQHVREYGPFYCDWIFSRAQVFVTDPMTLKDMMTDLKRFSRGEDLPIGKVGRVRLIGYHSILSDPGGPIWRKKKRIMDPAFSIPKLSEHLDKFYRIAADVIEALDAARQENPDGIVEMRDTFKPFTVDAISVAGFNATGDVRKALTSANARLESVLSDKVQGKSKLAMLLNSESRNGVLKAEKTITKLRELGKKLVLDRANGGEYLSKNDVLDKVIEANIDEKTSGLDFENCLDDFLTMYLAGNATTLTTLSWSVAELIRNPVILERLVEEVDAVWVSADIDMESEYSHIANVLKEMKYLDAFVKEVLRRHPPVCFNSKQTTGPETLGGYDIPAGTHLQTSQYVMHNYEKFFPNPEVLDPDRFLKGSPKPYTYFPFLMGPRQCIGKNFAILELKVILCEVLKRFELGLPEGAPEKIKSFQALLCFPVTNGVVLTPRY